MGHCIPHDGIQIVVECRDLSTSVYRSMGDCQTNVAALMQQVALLNSQNKFKIDNKLKFSIFCASLLSGVSKTWNHRHAQINRNRFAKSTVTVIVADSLCMPEALVHRNFCLTHDISRGMGTAASEWWSAAHKQHPRKLEQMAWIVAKKCGFSVGTIFDINDLTTFQNKCFP